MFLSFPFIGSKLVEADRCGLGFVNYMLIEVMRWPADTVKEFVDDFRKQLHDPKVHPWTSHRVVYGRRPL